MSKFQLGPQRWGISPSGFVAFSAITTDGVSIRAPALGHFTSSSQDGGLETERQVSIRAPALGHFTLLCLENNPPTAFVRSFN